jgi:hypothetical protein
MFVSQAGDNAFLACKLGLKVTLESSNQSLEREIDNVKASIQECQELRHRQQNTIYQSNGALSKWE